MKTAFTLEGSWQVLAESYSAPVVAAALIRGCKRQVGESPEKVHNILGNLWTSLALKTMPSLVNPYEFSTAAFSILGLYFLQKGDWKTMEAKMLNMAKAMPQYDPVKSEEFMEMIAKGLMEHPL